MCRQRGCCFQHVLKGQIVGPLQFDPPLKRFQIARKRLAQTLFGRGAADHHDHGLGRRDYSQHALKGSQMVNVNRDDRVVFSHCGSRDPALVYCCQQHRCSGEKPLPMPQHEISRRRPDGDDEVQGTSGIKLFKVVYEWTFEVIAAETSASEHLIHRIKRPPCLPFEFFANRSRVCAPRFEISAEGMQDHHALGIGGHCALAGKQRQRAAHRTFYCENYWTVNHYPLRYHAKPCDTSIVRAETVRKGNICVVAYGSSASNSRCPPDVGFSSNSGNVAALPRTVETARSKYGRYPGGNQVVCLSFVSFFSCRCGARLVRPFMLIGLYKNHAASRFRSSRGPMTSIRSELIACLSASLPTQT